MHAVKWYDAKGDVASRLRQRKYALLRGLHIPPDALPGSLALTHRRCGTPTCWCAKGGDGHPMWSLTFMANGKRRVEWIPNEWVEDPPTGRAGTRVQRSHRRGFRCQCATAGALASALHEEGAQEEDVNGRSSFRAGLS